MTGSAGFELARLGEGRWRLAGRLGFDTARAILERGEREFAGQRAIELDLSGVTHADSAGLALLLAWIERARRHGAALRLRALPAQLRGIARLSEVEPLLDGAAATR